MLCGGAGDVFTATKAPALSSSVEGGGSKRCGPMLPPGAASSAQWARRCPVLVIASQTPLKAREGRMQQFAGGLRVARRLAYQARHKAPD